jgi:shikimate dehydrogenase
MNLGLIGRSVSHSFSKAYFEEKFLKENLQDFSYINFDLASLDTLSEIIHTHHLSGLNVTKPYKQEIIPFLDELDETAKVIGAVNCIHISWQGDTPYLKGYNTDHYGFAQSIKPFLEPIHQRALVLGTGGASQAVHYALKHIGVEVYFVSRGPKSSANFFHYDELNEHVLNAFKLVVNCTPIGMYPAIDECPPLPYELMGPEHLLYDLIYNPVETQFLKKGKEQGAVTINGLNMLKLQAEKGWEIWNKK